MFSFCVLIAYGKKFVYDFFAGFPLFTDDFNASECIIAIVDFADVVDSVGKVCEF